jgi:hypothetical protein
MAEGPADEITRPKIEGAIVVCRGDWVPRVRNHITQVAVIVVGFFLSVVAIRVIAHAM